MSHLRPIDRETGKPKAIAEYSQSEKLSALTQVEEAIRMRIAAKQPVDQVTAQLAVTLSVDTPKEGTLAPEIIKAAKAN